MDFGGFGGLSEIGRGFGRFAQGIGEVIGIRREDPNEPSISDVLDGARAGFRPLDLSVFPDPEPMFNEADRAAERETFRYAGQRRASQVLLTGGAGALGEAPTASQVLLGY